MQKTYTPIISVDEASEAMKDKSVVIFDSRFYLTEPLKGRKEYLQSHIPGAVYLDTNSDLSSPVINGVTGRHPLPAPAILESTLRASGLNSGSLVIVYDQSNGAYASRAWWLLRWLGHQNVAVLDGGFKLWNSHHLPVDNVWPLMYPGNFKAMPKNELIVNINSLKEIHGALVDSREYKRYNGEYEPIDPVAGHIPGAICIPYMENTNESGEWKSPEELRKRFADLELESTEAPVFYCGSGVTACHNILAYKIATGKDSRLYPGSWSEWINYNKVKSEL
ncbi:MAG: sulfurtransferase [Saprospiraceae bacterium]